MVPFSRFFLVFTSYFLISQCSDLQIKEQYSGLNSKDNTLIIDGHNLDPGSLFSQMTSFKFLNELSLRKFVFDEISVKELSKVMSPLSIKKLSLIQCDFNEVMASLFSIPPSVRSIHLEELNLSSRGIEITLSELDPSVESITISACYTNERKKTIQSFSKFTSLKQIDIDKESIGSPNIYHSLSSLATASLESIKLRQFRLNATEIISIINEWTDKYGKSFADNLRVIEWGRFYCNFFYNNQLLQQLLSFDKLRILSCEFYDEHLDFSTNALPLSLEKLNLKDAIIDIEINQEPIFKQNILSAYHLTHLTVNNNFDEFPSHLFNMKSLEYLDLYGIYCHKMPISTEFQSFPPLKHLIIQSEHLAPFMLNFDKNFKVIERLEISFRNHQDTFNDLEILFTNSTLKALKLEFFINDLSNFHFKSNQKCECSFEELELQHVSWKFICLLLDKLTFPRLKKLNFHFKRAAHDLHVVLYKLQTLTELASLSFEGDVEWEFGEKVPFIFKNLTSFNLGFYGPNAIELDHLLLGMPKLQSLFLPTWQDNELLLQQPVISIRYLYLPMSVDEFEKTAWINFLKNLPNLVQLRNCSKKSIVEDGITTDDLIYYLKILKKYFKNELQFKIEYDCLPVLLLERDAKLLKLVRNKSKELVVYLNEIFPLGAFGILAKQLFTIEFEMFVSSINFPLLIKFFKLLNELGIERQPDAIFVKGILIDAWHGRFTETTDFSLGNFNNKLLSYLIEHTKMSLSMVHLEFLIKFYKTNKRYNFPTVIEFARKVFISPSNVDGKPQLIDNEMFSFFSSYLLASTFRPFFDKIIQKELSEKEKKFLPIDYESIGDDLKKLEPEQYEKLSAYFKDFLIKLTNESFIESFTNILKKILIPETKCAICFESLFSEECKFFNAGITDCHLYHKSCLEKWLSANNKCPHCREVDF